MASTRNKNTPGNYQSETNENNRIAEYMPYHSFAKPEQTLFCGNGLLPGRVGSQGLSHNACDVESFLYGIGSTNLVDPLPKTVAELKPLQSLNVMNKTPLLLPNPLVITPYQRILPS